MKRSLVLASLPCLLTLAGCASQPPTKADVDGRVVCHQDRMDEVERQAKTRKAQVQWINCPTVALRVVD